MHRFVEEPTFYNQNPGEFRSCSRPKTEKKRCVFYNHPFFSCKNASCRENNWISFCSQNSWHVGMFLKTDPRRFSEATTIKRLKKSQKLGWVFHYINLLTLLGHPSHMEGNDVISFFKINKTFRSRSTASCESMKNQPWVWWMGGRGLEELYLKWRYETPICKLYGYGETHPQNRRK